MDIKDYADIGKAQIAIITQIEGIIAKVDDDTTEQDWSDLYDRILPTFLKNDTEAARAGMEAARSAPTSKEKLTVFLSTLRTHYEQINAMTSETAKILGGFGVQGIKFV